MSSTFGLPKGKSQSYGSSNSMMWRRMPSSERRFDLEPEQVYSEIEVRPHRIALSDWLNEPKTPNLIKRPRKNEHGARSLAEMARIKLVTQFKNLTSDHFASVPWSVAEKLWEQLTSMRAETFHAWRTLAAAYPSADEFGKPEHRYLLEIKLLALPVSDYFRNLDSTSLNWLVCLRASPKQLKVTDLVAVHKINNLAVLDLSDGQISYDNDNSQFDERIMRSWAELAASGQAFQHLRVMMFGWQEHLSEWIFKYTDCFPSLCHIIITDCPGMHQKNRNIWEPISQAAGWNAQRGKRSAKILRPILENKDFYFGSISGFYYDSMELCDQLVHKKRPSLKARLPILEVWMQSPRRWSHIVDDFPSTRTIFFENIKTGGWRPVTGAPAANHREQTKRTRPQAQDALGTSSPPPKRGAQPRPVMKSNGKNLTEMLQEFKTW